MWKYITFASRFLLAACLGMVATLSSGLECGIDASVLETDGVTGVGCSAGGVGCGVTVVGAAAGMTGVDGTVPAGTVEAVSLTGAGVVAVVTVVVSCCCGVGALGPFATSPTGSTGFKIATSSFFSVTVMIFFSS